MFWDCWMTLDFGGWKGLIKSHLLISYFTTKIIGSISKINSNGIHEDIAMLVPGLNGHVYYNGGHVPNVSPLFEKGPTDENFGISYLIVIIKFGFFEISPPLFHQKAEPHRFIIKVAPK